MYLPTWIHIIGKSEKLASTFIAVFINYFPYNKILTAVRKKGIQNIIILSLKQCIIY